MPADTTGYPPEFAALLDNYNQEVTALMARLEAGKVTTAAWTKEMQGLLAKYSQAARMLGMGEVKLLPAEVDAVRAWLNEQFKYLDGFETVISSAGGEYDPAWLPRAQMYGASTVTEYWEGKTSGLPLPAMPGQGTQCLSNCRCTWDIQWIDKAKGDADAYWTLHPAEHCQTCLTRAEMWNPVRIRGGDLEGDYETPAPAPGPGGEGSMASRMEGSYAANGIVEDAPPILQKLINKTYIINNPSLPQYVAGKAPTTLNDGSMIMYARKRPTKATVIHEIIHAHQSIIQNKNPERYKKLHDSFISAAEADNISSGKKAIWSNSMIKNQEGDEIWTYAGGWLYGGSKGMIQEASPKVIAILESIYGK